MPSGCLATGELGSLPRCFSLGPQNTPTHVGELPERVEQHFAELISDRTLAEIAEEQ
jgi:hypothetical protein